MKILDEIDSLSKISVTEDDSNGNNLLTFMYEFASRAIDFLNIERINIWLLNKERNAIFSIAEYDKRNNSFSHHTWIYEKDVPHYFQHLLEDKIILAPNIHEHPATSEFSNNYAKQYEVISLMDIPLRLNGKLIGVMCFEKTGNVPRVFNELEQTFAISLAQLALAQIENNRRKAIQKKLMEALKEKELLIKELHHRVKNNFSVLVSLLRISKENVKKEKEEIFDAFEHQVFSMLKVHELLLESNTHQTINLPTYLKKLSEEFLSSYSEFKGQINFHIEEKKFEISAKYAINLGLMITEIFLNSIKYCILPHKGTFDFTFNVLSEDKAQIVLGDSCTFDFESAMNHQHSLGLSIIKDLAESSDFQVKYPSKVDGKYIILISR